MTPQLDTARREFKEKLKASKKNVVALSKKKPAEPGVVKKEPEASVSEMLRKMHARLEEIHALLSHKPGNSARVHFEVTERDGNGKIKSFKVVDA